MGDPLPPALPNLPHQEVAGISDQFPNLVAVIHAGGSLTYGELDQRTNRLARHLRSIGVGPEVVVALRIPRSPELVVTLLAVSKTGGAYLLLEPSAPAERLRSILERVGPSFVIAPETDPCFGTLSVRWCSPDSLERDAQRQPATTPDVTIRPDQTASIFLTSGSSGQPKAVVTPFGYRVQPPPPPPGSERHVLKSDSGTTFTRGEILTPLRTGQTLHIAPPGIERDARTLARYLADREITHLLLVPSALQSLLDLRDPGWTRTLRSVQCSGELLSPRLKRDFLEQTRASLVISYGCTEAPTATVRRLGPGGDPDDPSVGTPAPHMEVHILDDTLRPVPRGETGEVYIGGLMTRGYLDDPDGTALRYLPNPFATVPDARMFRTGDLGRWLPNGGLQILGRTDHQVKIRGHRVELEAVEALLSQHPSVAACAAAAREDADGHAALIGYIVPREGLAPDPTAIASFLRTRAPRELVPSRICLLDRLPCTSNGKLDRRALPDPDPASALLSGRDLPRDPVETQLAALWEALLHRYPIGIHDNFFDLGGHSLQVVTLLDQIEPIFHTRPPLDLLWNGDGTIASLAEFLRGQRDSGPHPDLIRLREGTRAPLFVTDVISGAGLIHYYKLLPGLAPDQAVYGLLAPGTFGPESPADSIAEIAAHCIRSLRVAQPNGPYRLAGYSSGGLVALEMASQLRRDGEPVERVVLLDTRRPRGAGIGRLLEGIRTRLSGEPAGLRDLFRCYGLILRRAAGLRHLRNQSEAHLWAQFHCQPGPYPGPVDFMMAREIPASEPSSVAGWASIFTGPLHVHAFPADHLSLMRPPRVHDLARQIQQLLDS
ncbi:MAG: AMP-binding protein [Verrucomicrobiales bacterium]|nr:AMP-binding protein [Verrucomicrobiales bacterium]